MGYAFGGGPGGKASWRAQAGAPILTAQPWGMPLEPRGAACQKRTTMKPPKTLSEGQRAYEAKRAAKAGVTLEKWLQSKQRQQEAETRAKAKATEAAKPPKKPGLLSRLLDRAHKPL